MPDTESSRRAFMKKAMVTAAYGAPTILAVTNTQAVAAMSPAPTNPTVINPPEVVTMNPAPQTPPSRLPPCRFPRLLSRA